MACRTLLASLLLTAVSANVVPRGYRLDLYPYPGDGVFKGRVRIDLVFPGQGETTRQVELHADPSLNIVNKEVSISRPADPFSSEEDDTEGEQVSLSVTKVERQNQSLIVHLSQPLQRDATYQLDVQFDGILGSDPNHAFFQNSYIDQTSGEKRWFVALNLKPYKTRMVFPCFDDPQLKTWIELSVAHKSEFHILSSMPVVDTTNVTTEGVWVMEHFSRTPPMSVNSLALFVSDFPQPISNNFLQTDGIRVGVWGRSDFVTALSKAQQLLPTVMVSLEIYLSRPYPLPQLNLVALPGYMDDTPINAWGLQLFKESDLMNGNTFWLSHRLARAAANQWLNHLTSPEPNTTSCITSGLANYLATIVAKQLEQQNIYHWHLTGLHSLYLEYAKPKSSYMNANQKEALCSSKVQIFLSMLDLVLTTQTFKTGIQNFLSKKEFKLYNDSELWAAIGDQAHQDGTLEKSVSVEEIAQSWLDRDRLPVLSVTRNYDKDTVIVLQEPFINHLESRWTPAKVVKKPAPPGQLWWVPVVVLKEPDTEDTSSLNISSTPTSWLKPDLHQLTLQGYTEDNKYIIVNPGTIGPFLVNYDPENWRLLSQRVTALPDSVRTQLLHDSLTLALAGQVDTATALNMTLFLKKEQSAVVWKTFYPLADRLRKQFQGTSAAKLLDEYIVALVTPVLEALGEETDKSPIWRTDFRTKTRHLLCAAGHPTCVEHAQAHYAKWISSQSPDSGMPLAGSLLCSVFSHGTPEEWEFGIQRLLNFPTNRSSQERTFLLKSLAGCSREPDQYERVLNVTLLQDVTNQTFSEADKFATLTAMSEDVTGCTALFNFLSENWKILKKRLSPNLWEYLIQVALGRFRTQEGLVLVSEMVEERKGQFGNAEATAEEAVETVKAQVKWTEVNSGPVELWLNQTMSKPWPPQRFKFQDILVLARTRKFG
ncbi:aminopeptidase N-like [Macrosteles quadrilineatus]|uniref:aminopeptidase N-like n=1 Tax=Macrosteles quadrilineatus TaxID=74068 RepID=UPI0023E2B264|nr:aminopeptidase N-like [Macrosteles quadrilineatus]XP_054279502.1 aminopeptidase N-like [Macrosteles quadrilineatus]